ncbi:MAG: response regulator [Spirochaetaceae bacterium]|nr:response regulator [Spirochaetaceae bacterium]MCF7949264.1 response regulator [Spirochaetia bacterium]MCF7952330.1 response regulator [Spirochaetaceae bacterium]
MNTPDSPALGKKDPLILIVDDVPENVEILYSVLAQNPYRFAIALNAAEMYKAIEKEVPDLILLDVMLPDGDGFALAEDILSVHNDYYLPIIFITARAHLEDKVRGFEAGGVDYITKPFEDAEVSIRVKTHVELKLAREQQAALIQQLQQALKEVKQLRGIIPICAHCKKVRNDDGYWMQVEHYVSEHSEAEFSHGLCPVCMNEMYPHLSEEEEE